MLDTDTAPPIPKAHEQLLTTHRSKQSPHLGDYIPTLRTPTDDPAEDLSRDPLESFDLKTEFNRIKVGSRVTVNTVYLGTVVETLTEEDIDYRTNTLLGTQIYRIDVDNPDRETIFIVNDGGTRGTYEYLSPATVDAAKAGEHNPKQVDGKANRLPAVPIKHLTVSNEHALDADIHQERYNAFKSHKGATAIRCLQTGIHLTKLVDITDGEITYLNPNGSERTQTVTQHNAAPAWLLFTDTPFSETPTILPGRHDHLTGTTPPDPDADNGLAASPNHGPLGTTLTEEQAAAIETLITTLPPAIYSFTTEGLQYNENFSNSNGQDQSVWVKAISQELTDKAFPFSPAGKAVEAASTDGDHISLPDVERPALSDPITEITGIGKKTAMDLSGCSRRSLGSTSTKQLRNQFVFLPEDPTITDDSAGIPAQWDLPDEPVEIAEADLPDELDDVCLDYVRKLPEDEIPPELKQAQEDYDPPASASEPSSGELLSIAEFIDEGLPLSQLTSRFFIKAVAQMREALLANAHRKTMSPREIFQLHLGATNGYTFDEEGTHNGNLPNFTFGSLDLANISAVSCRHDSSYGTPLLNFDNAPDIVIATDEVSKYNPGNKSTPLELPTSAEWMEATELNIVNGNATIYAIPEEAAPAAYLLRDDTAASIASVPQEIIQYLAVVFGFRPDSKANLVDHIAVTNDQEIIITHPEQNVTAYVLPW